MRKVRISDAVLNVEKIFLIFFISFKKDLSKKAMVGVMMTIILKIVIMMAAIVVVEKIIIVKNVNV